MSLTRSVDDVDLSPDPPDSSLSLDFVSLIMSTSKLTGFLDQNLSEKLLSDTRETDDSFYDSVYRLVRQGREAPSDRQSFDGLITETPRELTQAKSLIIMRAIQIHAVSKVLMILKQHGTGALLALDMGLGKTLIIFGMQLHVETIIFHTQLT
jgi:SNF2 family DNA or RNA helicase